MAEDAPKQYRYLKYEPKDASDDGWNARCLGSDFDRCPYSLLQFFERKAWQEAFKECGAYLSQEIG